MMSESEVLLIESKKKISGTGPNFITAIQYDESIGYNRCALIQASIPKSYYLIDDTLGENTFDLIVDTTTYKITLDNGEYSRETFRSEIQEKLNDILLGVTEITDPNANWQVQYSANPSLDLTSYAIAKEIVPRWGDDGSYYFILIATDIGLDISFEWDSTKTIPAKVMGYDYTAGSAALAEGDSPITSTHVYFAVSTRPASVDKYDVIYLQTNMVGSQYNSNLAELYAGEFNSWDKINYFQTEVLFNSRKFQNGIKNISFTLVDENDVVLDLNGGEVQFTIVLFKLRDISKKLEALGDLLALQRR